ncbi:uncharacterized protein KD926_005338 [Aspergillus affinis]|uniref:uncharacterized protein n=1 Tax=Aspergillus affinis TaxID=1070780 RepID=UPI0022FE8E4F|nr:uncharacterized protein KD926_005338 [Aspergillus affinis]KAI9034824.1 hypothetical protein KD926_005338 [Aspergillus affinis]
MKCSHTIIHVSVTCRSRHLKCDETKPTCTRCTRGKRECIQADPAANFRYVFTTARGVKPPIVSQKKTEATKHSTFNADNSPIAAHSPVHNQEAASSPGILAQNVYPFITRDEGQLAPTNQPQLRAELSLEMPCDDDIDATLSTVASEPNVTSSVADLASYQGPSPGSSDSISVAGAITVAGVPELYAPPRENKGISCLEHAALFRFFKERWAPGLDSQDADRHFTLEVQQRAQRAPVLLNAILAVASLHQSRLSGSSIVIAEQYHEACVKLILGMLYHADGPIDELLLATTVILRVYEQMNGSFNDDECHLLGASALASAQAATNGHLWKAAFWIYLRQDIYMAILDQRPIKTDLSMCTLWENEIPTNDCEWSQVIVLIVADIIGFCFSSHNEETAESSGGQMIAGRVIAGLGNGVNTATIPTWNSEIVGSHNRGRLNAISGTMIGVGICLSYWFDYGMAYVNGSVQWRLPIAIQIAFAGATLFMAIYLPESPRWLTTQGRIDEAVHVLACLESEYSNSETPAVIAKCQDIQLALNAEQAMGPLKWSELWESKLTGNRKRIILACGIMVFQQMSGINALVYYIPYLLENSVGLPANTALLISGLVGVIFVVFSAYAFIFIDKWGRRKPFIVTSIAQSLSMIMVAILLSLETPTASKASVVFFFLYMAAFGACYLGVPWSYAPELLPLRNRVRGCAVASAVNWTCNFAIVEFVPSAIANISWRTYIIFAVLNFTWAPLLYLFYPETARMTMEEIDNLFVKEPISLHTLTAHVSHESGTHNDKVAVELQERT